MPSAPCDWAWGAVFLSQCEDDELVLNYAGLALECIRAVLAACLAVAATHAWRRCRGEARTGHRVTVQAASTQTDLSFATVSPAMAISFRCARSSLDPSIALAKVTSIRARSKSDSTTALARARKVPPVTPSRHARKEGSQMRSAAEKRCDNRSSKRDEQRSFSQLDADRTQTQTPVARKTQSRSVPNIKVSGAAAFLAEVVRRHAEMEATSPETPVRTPVWPPRSAWSKEARAFIESCEGKGDQDEALAQRRCDMQAGVHDAVRDAVTVTSPGADIARERYSVQGAPLPQVAAAGSQTSRTPT